MLTFKCVSSFGCNYRQKLSLLVDLQTFNWTHMFKKYYAFFVMIAVWSACGNKNQAITTNPQSITVVKVIQQDVPIYRYYVGQIPGSD
jgi:hypothetical protein